MMIFFFFHFKSLSFSLFFLQKLQMSICYLIAIQINVSPDNILGTLLYTLKYSQFREEQMFVL